MLLSRLVPFSFEAFSKSICLDFTSQTNFNKEEKIWTWKHGHGKRIDTNIHLPINHAAQFCVKYMPSLTKLKQI